MKKFILSLLLAMCLIAAKSNAQSVSPVTFEVHANYVVMNYQIGADFFDWYDVNRFVHVTRTSDSNIQTTDFGKFYPDRNLYLDSTLGATNCFQVIYAHDTIKNLDPQTTYTISLVVAGFDSSDANNSVSAFGNGGFTTTALSGIDDVAGSGMHLSVYPNPTANVLNVKGAPLNAVIEIIDMSGRVVQSQLVQSENITFDVLGLPPGVYFARCEKQALKFIRRE